MAEPVNSVSWLIKFEKKLIFCHKLKFSNPSIFANFDISNSVHLIQKNVSLKCLSYAKLGCKDKGIRKLEYMAKTEFLSSINKFGSLIGRTWKNSRTVIGWILVTELMREHGRLGCWLRWPTSRAGEFRRTWVDCVTSAACMLLWYGTSL